MFMRFPNLRLNRKRTSFRTDTDGAVTVEAAIWLPFFILFVFGIAEMALVFHGQARALQVAQDANRGFTVGEFEDAAETAAWAKESLASYSNRIQSTTVLNGGVITTVIKIPASDLAGNIGIFSILSGIDITVVSQQVLES